MKPRRSATGRTRLRELGEDLLLQKLFRLLPAGGRVVRGSGDDAAIVAGPAGRDLLVLKTDCVVEGVHFERNTRPQEVGWKAMMRPLSDFAAVSAVPEFGLVTLVIGGGREVKWVTQMYQGLSRAARRFRVSVVGGETSNTSGPVVISVCVIGRVEKDRWVSRAGGKSGDSLFVTGRLGNTLKRKHLNFIPRIIESRWLTANFRVHAMMDLSDGLGADLPRLARASETGFHVERESIPLNRGASVENAISGGEDYELLFAVAPRESKRLQNSWARKFPKLSLTRIGYLSQRSTRNSQLLPGGYVHFR